MVGREGSESVTNRLGWFETVGRISQKEIQFPLLFPFSSEGDEIRRV